MSKELWKGNHAIAEAAVRAGLEAFFGYPITPQSELLEHMSLRMPDLDRVFLQAESEVAAINMVYGAAAAGARVMTSSSGPGISLMQEGLSYIAASEVPVVIADIMRGGPGLGNIQPSQSDYNQITKTAGHGDFRPIVLAPSSIQEAIDMTVLAFDLADQYRTLVFVLADGMIGQMMEPAELPPLQAVRRTRPAWALTGNKGRDKNIVTSLYLGAEKLEALNTRLQAKLQTIRENEVRYETVAVEDADILLVAFGTAGRIAKTAMREARAQGIRVGLLRPITLFPFPNDVLLNLSKRVQTILTVEMNAGQMVEDVKLAIEGNAPVHFYGRTGGAIPLPDEILSEILKLNQTYPAKSLIVDEAKELAPVMS